LKSLNVSAYVALKVHENKAITLTEEGLQYADKGTPEYQYTNALVMGE
jgi:hypothetical protein